MLRKIVILIIAVALLSCSHLPVENACRAQASLSVSLQGFETVAENGSLRLMMHGKTTEIAVAVKDTGAVYFSNPQGRQSYERIASGRAKERLSSQFSITYFTPEDRQMTMNNYSDGVAHGQYEIQPIDSGIRINYTLGKEWEDTARIPVMIAGDRMEREVLSQISSRSDRSFVESCYYFLELQREPGRETYPEVYGMDSARVFADLRLVSVDGDFGSEDKAMQFLVDQIAANRGDRSNRAAVRAEDVAAFVDNPTYVLKTGLFKWDTDDLAAIMQDVGYTPEQAQEDHVASGIDPPRRSERVFRVPIEYCLDGDDFVVRIPTEGIEYPVGVTDADGSRVTYPLHSIDLMRYFGAADRDSSGYMMVPDGSGALIYLNNGKTYTSAFSMPIYGRDHAVELRSEKLRPTQQANLPVYGMKQGDQAFLAIIEEGASLATVSADVAGRDNSYNTVWARFVLLPMSVSSLRGEVPSVIANQESKNAINVYQSRKYLGAFQVRYSFLSGDDADYVGMGCRYREYLIDTNYLSPVEPRTEIPLYLELVGSIRDRKPILGIARDVTVGVTTFEDAVDVVEDPTDRGIENLKLLYSGWLQGGVRHAVPSGVRIERAVGGESGLRSLVAAAQKCGVELFPEVGFLYVYRDGWFDGFSRSADASRWLNRKTARLYDYNEATKQVSSEDFAYILSPRVLPRIIEEFLRGYSSLGVGGLTLRDIGTQVNSDFREGNLLVDREQAVDVQVEQLIQIRDAVPLVLSKGANAYVLPHVDGIVELPLVSSGFRIEDESIPFYQIAVHGLVSYAGEPINLADDYRESLLKSIEVGAYPYFRLFENDGSAVKGTNYDHLHSCEYSRWADQMVAAHRAVDIVLRDLQDSRMTGHERVDNGVYRTTYEDGTTVTVDYNNYSVEVCGNGSEAVGLTLAFGGSENER